MADRTVHIVVKDVTMSYGSYVIQKNLNFTINHGWWLFAL